MLANVIYIETGFLPRQSQYFTIFGVYLFACSCLVILLKFESLLVLFLQQRCENNLQSQTRVKLNEFEEKTHDANRSKAGRIIDSVFKIVFPIIFGLISGLYIAQIIMLHY